MAIKYYEKYPQRWESPSQDYPQGAFKNLSALGEQDGSYLEASWLNDQSGFFGALLRNAEMTPNGSVDTAQKSQFYDALIKVAKSAVADQGYATKTYVDNKFNEVPKTEIINDWDQASDENVFSAGFVSKRINQGADGNTIIKSGAQTFTFPSEGGELTIKSVNDLDLTHILTSRYFYTIATNVDVLRVSNFIKILNPLSSAITVDTSGDAINIENSSESNIAISLELPVLSKLKSFKVDGEFDVVVNASNSPEQPLHLPSGEWDSGNVEIAPADGVYNISGFYQVVIQFWTKKASFSSDDLTLSFVEDVERWEGVSASTNLELGGSIYSDSYATIVQPLNRALIVIPYSNTRIPPTLYLKSPKTGRNLRLHNLTTGEEPIGKVFSISNVASTVMLNAAAKDGDVVSVGYIAEV